MPGAGRPQAKINDDLAQCDYAIFMFHDRWGSPSGDSGKVGTEEEWELAEHYYGESGGYKMREITIYFKDVVESQTKDPGQQYQKVLDFKKKLFVEKKHLCGKFANETGWSEHLRDHLGAWLAKHIDSAADTRIGDLAPKPGKKPRQPAKGRAAQAEFDGFAFWNQQGVDECAREPVDHTAALIFFERALQAGKDDQQIAKALFNNGVTLGALNRSEEALAVYDDLIGRFGDSSALAVTDIVKRARRLRGIGKS